MFVKHESYLHCISSQRKLFHPIHKHTGGCVDTSHANDSGSFLTATQNSLLSFFICIFLDFQVKRKVMVFRSQLTKDADASLRNELFNAIALKGNTKLNKWWTAASPRPRLPTVAARRTQNNRRPTPTMTCLCPVC